MSSGKGDAPRSCFSKAYKNNYDNISWDTKKQNKACPKCGYLVRFGFKACRTCGYEFR